MGVLTRFDPPAFMSDLDRIARGHAEWHEFMNTVFNWAIGTEQPVVKPRAGSAAATVQFFNPAAWDPEAPVIEQAVTWNAFPKELLLRFGQYVVIQGSIICEIFRSSKQGGSVANVSLS